MYKKLLLAGIITPIIYTSGVTTAMADSQFLKPACCYIDRGESTGDDCVSYTCGRETYYECTRCPDCNGQAVTPITQTATVCSGTTVTYQTCPLCLTGPIKSCNKGEYKKADGTCAPCPDGGTTNITFGDASITDCYIPSGTTSHDETGTFEYTANCPYLL